MTFLNITYDLTGIAEWLHCAGPADADPAHPVPVPVLHAVRLRPAVQPAAEQQVSEPQGHAEPQGAILCQGLVPPGFPRVVTKVS